MLAVANPILMDNHQTELAKTMSAENYLTSAILNDKRSESAAVGLGNKTGFFLFVKKFVAFLRMVVAFLAGIGWVWGKKGKGNHNGKERVDEACDEDAEEESQPGSESSDFHRRSLATKLLEMEGFKLFGETISRGVSICGEKNLPGSWDLATQRLSTSGTQGHSNYISWSYREDSTRDVRIVGESDVNNFLVIEELGQVSDENRGKPIEFTPYPESDRSRFFEIILEETGVHPLA
jgi:hypothetical protein